MFEPSKAEISIERSQPALPNVQTAIKKIQSRNAIAAAAIMIKSQTSSKANSVVLLSRWRLSERITAAKDFLESWNAWSIYFDSESRTYVPSGNSSMTFIEAIKEYVEERGLDLDVMIGCGFLAWRGRKPHLSTLAANMNKYYEEFSDKVISEMETASGAVQHLSEENY